MPITPLPALDRTSATFKTDVDTFFGSQIPAFCTEANALESNVNAKEASATTSAANAATSETNAASSASAAATSASNAAASAQAAVNAPGTSATSTTSLTIGAGSQTLAIQTGKSIVVGMSVKVASTATPTNWMFGDVTAYNSGTGSLTVNVTATNGSGTASAWTVSLAGQRGPAGADGQSALTTRSARTSNTMLVAANKGEIIDITSGTFTQTFAACATLGNGWSVWITNSGTGNITLDPYGSELIDGVTSGVMKPGMTFLITCDGASLSVLRVDTNTIVEVLTSGTSWTAPLGVRRAKLRMSGGGASGTAASGSSANSGGGAGGYLEKMLRVTPGAAYAYSIGVGGASVSGSSTGNSGGTSTFNDGTTLYTANGGSAASFSPSSGGTAVNGDVNVRGGSGYALPSSDRGIGGCNPLGSVPCSSASGISGVAYGYGTGGTGSSAGNATGDGAQGVVILEY